jgi:hypothetical protein
VSPSATLLALWRSWRSSRGKWRDRQAKGGEGEGVGGAGARRCTCMHARKRARTRTYYAQSLVHTLARQARHTR